MAAAQAAATGGPPAALIDHVTGQLTRVLSLEACRSISVPPAPGARPTLEQRLLAVALADQVGAALATSHPVGQD